MATPALAVVPAGLVFEARALTKVYHMGEVDVHALRGVDLELREGELVVLLGPSGSGKSTLLNILGGLDVPSAGQVLYHGRDLAQAGEAELTDYRRHHVGFVFQFYNLIPSLTTRENVALVTEIVDRPMRPEEALGLVGLAERLDHFPAQLSGGEQQRVAIARALVTSPALILADEPTGNLDSKSSEDIMGLFDRLVGEGNTIILVTHEHDVGAHAKRMVRLKDGLIVEDHLQ